MKNYELLESTKSMRQEQLALLTPEKLAKRREKLAGSPSVSHYWNHIKVLQKYPCWKHMGFAHFSDVSPELLTGLSVVEDYFFGDWWTEENIRRVSNEAPDRLRLTQWKTVESTIVENVGRMDRSSPGCKFLWHGELRAGIIFGGLLEEWDKVAHICSAVDAETNPEYSAGTIVEEYFKWYLCVAGRLSDEWTDGMDQLLADVKQCRQKRLRDCVAAWEAAVATDQTSFDKAFTTAVKSFIKKKDDPSKFEWVALDETVIWLIANKNGLTFPDMPDKLRAAVMTRESLGLAE